MKDPLNEQSITIGLTRQLVKGVMWFQEAVTRFRYPVLMLHGEKDALVNMEDTSWFFKNVSSEDKQMKIYGHLYHEIFNEYCKEEVVGDVIRWIEARC